jgi:chromosome segregation ATPase
MRKAFDANVPKLRPRLKSQVEEGPVAVGSAPEPSLPFVPSVAAAEAAAKTRDGLGAETSPEVPSRPSTSGSLREPYARDERNSEVAPGATAQAGPTSDVASRRERLAKIKRRVAEAAKPRSRAAPAPADPAQAAVSVLGLVKDLERELVSAREREDALRADLEAARADVARFAGEGRASAERLTAAESELVEKRSVLEELLGEMGALEEERDEAVRRAQALSALDEERARLLEDVTRRADEEARLRAEREAEVEKLSEELRGGATESARLRAAIGELARERDQLAGDLDRTKRERDELAAAKGALEQVHAALAQARARIG